MPTAGGKHAGPAADIAGTVFQVGAQGVQAGAGCHRNAQGGNRPSRSLQTRRGLGEVNLVVNDGYRQIGRQVMLAQQIGGRGRRSGGKLAVIQHEQHPIRVGDGGASAADAFLFHRVVAFAQAGGVDHMQGQAVDDHLGAQAHRAWCRGWR